MRFIESARWSKQPQEPAGDEVLLKFIKVY